MQRHDASIFGEPSPAQMVDELEATEEIEHEGRLYRVPAALKNAFMARSEYARRAQELAAFQRALEGERQGFAAHVERAQATIADRARLAMIDDQLEQFESVDWELFAQEDLQAAQALWARYQELAQAREQYAWSLSQGEQEEALRAEQEMAARLAQTGTVLAAEIEGWSPEVAAKLVEYAGAFGVTIEELREVADPRLWKILHRAHLGEELMRRQETARRAEQLQAIRPAAQVGGAAAAGGGIRDDLGAKEWMQRRNQQVSAAR